MSYIFYIAELYLILNVGVWSLTTEIPESWSFTPELTMGYTIDVTTIQESIGSAQPMTCPQGKIFCLQTGRCITPEPCRSQEVTKCPSDHIFCLQTGRCLPKNDQCLEPSCDYGKYYCKETKSCIPTWEPCQTTTARCKDDQVFCLQTGRCIPKEPCGNDQLTSHTQPCKDGYVFCLQRGMCIPMNSCDRPSPTPPTSHTQKCHDGYVFCLQRGMCIPMNSCDRPSPSPPTSHTQKCENGYFFCLQRGMCIPRNSCDRPSPTPPTSHTQKCEDGYIFCLQRGMCIPKNSCDRPSPSPPTSHTQKCEDGYVFCLQRGMCIPKNSCDRPSPSPSTSHTQKCEDGYIFCLQRGMCIPKNSCDRPSPSPPTSHAQKCQNGYVFCLQRGMCILKNSCDRPSPSPTTSHTQKCEDGSVFCLQRGMCIPKNSCDRPSPSPPTSHTQKCEDGYVFCLQRGMCIPKNSCDRPSPSPPTSHTQKCEDGYVFCLQRGMCIPKNSCDRPSPSPPTSHTQKCEDGYVFCLQRGMCIPKNSCDRPSPSPPTSHTQKCEDGYVFCLHRGMCIPKHSCDRPSPSPPTSHTQKCEDGYVFCLQRGMCIPKNSCDRPSPSPPTSHTQKCEDGYIFCLQRGMCIPRNSCDRPSPSPSTSHAQKCHEGYVFCLQRGMCIPKNFCDRPSPSPPTSHTQKCHKGYVFCLQRGMCIPRNSCDRPSPSPPTSDTQKCHEGYVFCLQRGMCIPRNSCDRPSPSPPTSHTQKCEDGYLFCLQRGMCIPKNSCDRPSPSPPTSDTQKCHEGYVFCLQRGMCIPRNSCDRPSLSPPTSHTQKCEDGYIFCLQRGMCIPKNSCDRPSPSPPTSHTQKCEDGYVFCLQRGTCIPKNSCDRPSPSPPTSHTQKCEDGYVFCLQRGMCIPKNSCDRPSPSPPTSHTQKCEDGYIFCLQRGMCIPRNSCDRPSPSPSTSHTQKCEDGYVFCLQRGMCIPKNFCDRPSPSPPTSHAQKCQNGYVFCLQRGMCIPMNSCDRPSPSPPTSDTQKCQPNQIFCLQRGTCIRLDTCDEQLGNESTTVMYDVTTPPVFSSSNSTLTCSDTKVFCLQSASCMSLTEICSRADNVTVDSVTEVYDNTTLYFNDTSTALYYNDTGTAGYYNYTSTALYYNDTGTAGYYNGTSTVRYDNYTSASDYNNGTLTTVDSSSVTPAVYLNDTSALNDTTSVDTMNVTTDSTAGGNQTDMSENTTSTSDITITTPSTVERTENMSTESTSSGTDSDSLSSTVTMTTTSLSDSTTLSVDTSTPEVTTETTTEGTSRNFLMLFTEILTADSAKEISIPSLSANVNPSTSVDLTYPIHLRCSNHSGISWKINSSSGPPVELTNSTTLTQNDIVMVTTNGSTSGLLTCLIVDTGSGTSRDTYTVGILVVASPLADITMTVDKLTVNEGTIYVLMPNWTEIFIINLPDENPIDSSMELISSDTSILNTYRQMIQAYSGDFTARIQFDPVPRDVNQNVAAALQIWSPGSGSWITQRSMYTAPGLTTNIRTEYRHRLRLSTAYNGEFSIVFTMQDNQILRLVIEVVAVNDAPTFRSFGRRGVSEPIESLLLYPYSGTFSPVVVSDLASAIYTDEEGDTLGLAFIGFTSTHIGTWQYLLNGNWETFTDLGNVQPTQNVTVTLLSATDKIRFQPNNVNILWSQLEAQRYTQLFALASDGTSIGTVPADKSYQIYLQRCSTGICGMGGSSSFSKEVVKLYMSRSGCDGKPGSKLENDRCGECGSSDTCVDCSGIVNGGAVRDQCNECTGGTTGVTFNHNLDCGDSCEAEHYIHPDLQMCLPNKTDVQKLLDELTGCDNVLHSGAVINNCGHCVLGTTNRTLTYGLDECGICNGNDTSCTDCNGVVNGNHVLDACGSCLVPSDPTFNIGCVKIVSITPSMIGASGSRSFEIRGANLTNYESVRCQFVKTITNQVIQLTTTNFTNQNNKIIVTTPALSSTVVGSYSVRCTFDQILTLTMSNQDVTIFNYPVVNEVVPSEMTLKQEQTVTVRGSGFISTGYIKCAVRCPYTDPNMGCFSTELVTAGFVIVPAKRLNGSAVECDFRRMSAVRKAMGYSITVMVERFSDNNKNMLSYAAYRVIAPAPLVRQSYIHSRYCLLTIQFDTYIEVSSCTDILSTNSWTYIAGQSDIRCNLIGDRVLIKLSRGSTIQPGHTLTLEPNVTKQAKSLSSYALYASGDFVVSEARVSDPIFRIVGPKVVGSCDPFTLTLIQKDVGCVTLTYNWTVSANDSNPSADVVTDIETLQAKLNDLSVSTKRIYIDGDEIIPGSTYNFTVTVFNSRENITYETSMIVKRSVDVQPIRVRLKVADDITQFDVVNVLRMRAVISLSKCANNTGGEIGFEWVSQTKDFSFSDFADNPYALVKSNAMRGGTSYTISVNVYFKDQMDVSSTSEVTVYTRSNPLLVRIRGGEKIKTLASQATVLDASLSVDPDRNIMDTAYYVWSCEEETSGVTCFVIQNGQSVTLRSLSQQTSSTSSSLTIPANLMSSDKRYKFTVRMIKGSRMGNYTTTVQVIDSLPPTIETPVISLTVNYDEPLRVTSIVSSTGPVTMYWDCEEDLTGYDYIELADYVQSNQLFTQKTEAVQDFQFSLYTASQLPPGAKFALRVTATNTQNGLSATSNIYVTVNSAPEIGDFSVSPANGTALETDFELTIGDGWSDRENDALYFTFFTRKTGGSWIQLNTRGLTNVVSYSFITTSGIHDVIVKVCDSSGACSVKDQLQVLDVDDKVLTTQDIDETKQTMDVILQTGDMDKATGMAVSLTTAIDGTSTILQTLVNTVVKSILYTLAPSYDPSETSDVLGTINNLLGDLGDKGVLSLDVIVQAQQNAYQLAVLVTTGSSQTARRRRKRAVPSSGGSSSSSSSSSVTPMSVSTATNTLTTYSTTFLAQNVEDITSQSASDYLTVLDNVMIGLCAEVTNAEPATVIQSKLTTLRIRKRSMDTIATELIDVTCSDCPSYVAYPVKAQYGPDIQSLYTFWNCTSDGTKQCYGACLASAQMTTDLVTVTSSTGYGDLVQRSNVMFIKMVNPETYNFITVTNLTAPIDVFVPIIGAVNTTAYGFQCMMWKSSNWTNETCTSYGYAKAGANGSMYEVRCSCYETGILSVFEGPVQEEIITTEAETTEITTVSTPSSIEVPSTADKVYTQLIFTNDYDTTLATFPSQSDMNSHFKQKLSTDLSVSVSRITDLSTYTGSIIVTFAILKRSSQTEDTIGVILARLQDKVQTNTLTITDHNGQVLTVDTGSFKWSLTPYSYGEEAGQNSALIIAGAVAGVVALIVIVFIIVYLVMKKKKKKTPSVSPTPAPSYGQNMQGVDVPRKPGNIRLDPDKAGFSDKGRINVQPASEKLVSKPGDGELPLPGINQSDRFKEDNTDMKKVVINGKEDRFKQDDTDIAISIAGDNVIRQSGADSGVGTNSGDGDNVLSRGGTGVASSVGVGIGGGMSSHQNTETDTWIEKEIKTSHIEETRSDSRGSTCLPKDQQQSNLPDIA